MDLKREYKIIIGAYVIMQLLLGTGSNITHSLLLAFGYNTGGLEIIAYSIWITVSFAITLVITLYYLKDEFQVRKCKKLAWFSFIAWSIFGMFLVLLVQDIAIRVESFIGIEKGSTNTNNILSMIKMSPVIFLSVAIIGPILEEIIFRKIIFGTFFQNHSFFFSAFISSLIFAAAHLEWEHIILYSAIGFTFAFLYVHTKTIIVPIFTHIFMNSSVILIQFFLQNG